MAYVVECVRHSTLERSSSILQAEREIFISKGTPRTDECSLVLIGRCNIYLIILGKAVHQGINLAASTFVNDLIYEGSGVIVLRTGPINIMVINADSYSTLLLIYRDNV